MKTFEEFRQEVNIELEYLGQFEFVEDGGIYYASKRLASDYFWVNYDAEDDVEDEDKRYLFIRDNKDNDTSNVGFGRDLKTAIADAG